MQPYTEDFFKTVRDGSRKSAQEIVSLVLELIQPKSVIDVGCGVGTWLSVFKKLGVEDILGVDGDYVDKEMLEIPTEQFLTFDLKNPFSIERQFDLVVSLEVAEHLPKECAETFVESLVRLGPVILFSAAIPFQGGTDHINEQWQTYWVQYFQKQGYVAIDSIRRKVWQNDNVEYWYAQNILMFVQNSCIKNYPLLEQELEIINSSQFAIVHPKKYLEVVEKYLAAAKAAKGYQDSAEWYEAEAERYKAKAEPSNMSLKKILSALPIVAKNALSRRSKK